MGEMSVLSAVGWGVMIGWFLRRPPQSKASTALHKAGQAVVEIIEEAADTLRFAPDCQVSKRADARLQDGRLVHVDFVVSLPLERQVEHA